MSPGPEIVVVDAGPKDCGLCGNEIETPIVLVDQERRGLVVCVKCNRIIERYEKWRHEEE
jgi:ribosome-binding protein aMBF1 (putative translation factor)